MADINLETYSDLITLKFSEGNNFTAHWTSSDKYVGDFIQEVDGFFVFYPRTDISGAYTEAYALAIGAKLLSMNEDWKEELSKIR